MIDVTVTGVREIERRLANLKQAAANRALRAGITAGAKIENKAAKSNVKPGKLKLLKKSIGQVVRVYRHSNIVVGMIGPRKGMGRVVNGKLRDPAKYSHIEERGRGAVRAKRGAALSDGTTVYGFRVKPYRGRPFLRPAFEANRTAIMSAIAAKTMERIEAEARK